MVMLYWLSVRPSVLSPGDGFLLADPHGCQSREQEAAHSRLHTVTASHWLGSGSGWAQLPRQERKMAALQGT